MNVLEFYLNQLESGADLNELVVKYNSFLDAYYVNGTFTVNQTQLDNLLAISLGGITVDIDYYEEVIILEEHGEKYFVSFTRGLNDLYTFDFNTLYTQDVNYDLGDEDEECDDEFDFDTTTLESLTVNDFNDKEVHCDVEEVPSHVEDKIEEKYKEVIDKNVVHYYLNTETLSVTVADGYLFKDNLKPLKVKECPVLAQYKFLGFPIIDLPLPKSIKARMLLKRINR